MVHFDMYTTDVNYIFALIIFIKIGAYKYSKLLMLNANTEILLIWSFYQNYFHNLTKEYGVDQWLPLALGNPYIPSVQINKSAFKHKTSLELVKFTCSLHYNIKNKQNHEEDAEK